MSKLEKGYDTINKIITFLFFEDNDILHSTLNDKQNIMVTQIRLKFFYVLLKRFTNKTQLSLYKLQRIYQTTNQC